MHCIVLKFHSNLHGTLRKSVLVHVRFQYTVTWKTFYMFIVFQWHLLSIILSQKWYKYSVRYSLTVVFQYQTTTIIFLHCTVIFLIKICSLVLHHFVFLTFLSDIHFPCKLDDYIIQMAFHCNFVCVWLSRKDIYPINNIQYFLNDAKIYVSRSCFIVLLFREDYFYSIQPSYKVSSIFSQHVMLAYLFMYH